MNNSIKNLFYGTMFAGMLVVGTHNMPIFANDDVVVKEEVMDNQESDDSSIEKEDIAENEVDNESDTEKEDTESEEKETEKEETDKDVENSKLPEDQNHSFVYEVKNKDGESDSSFITTDTKFKSEKTQQQLELIANSITKGNKDALIEALAKCYGMNQGTLMGDKNPVKFINKQFVDTEKIDGSNTDLKEHYDSELCWVQAAANMLWSSGWGKEAINPITGKNFTSEDDIATYFSTYISNEGGRTNEAIEWFFNGTPPTGGEHKSLLTKPSSNPKYSKDNSYGYGVDQTGLLKKYDVSKISSVVDLRNSKLEGISALNKLNQNNVAGISIDFIEELCGSQSFAGGHALSATGFIIDPTKSGLDKYVAILVADGNSDKTGEHTTLPDSYETVLNKKNSIVNGYTLYYLQVFTDQKNNKWWELVNYDFIKNDCLKRYCVIKKIQLLENRTLESMSQALVEDETNNESKTNDKGINGNDDISMNDTDSAQESTNTVTATKNVVAVSAQNTTKKTTVQTSVFTSSLSFLMLMVTSLGAFALSFKKVFEK